MIGNQKRKPYRNKKILAAIKGCRCFVNGPFCTGGGEDTVPAHSNSSDDGKGMGIKADDIFTSAACGPCHDWLDGRGKRGPYTDNEIRWFHDRAIKRTIRYLLDKGVIK